MSRLYQSLFLFLGLSLAMSIANNAVVQDPNLYGAADPFNCPAARNADSLGTGVLSQSGQLLSDKAILAEFSHPALRQMQYTLYDRISTLLHQYTSFSSHIFEQPPSFILRKNIALPLIRFEQNPHIPEYTIQDVVNKVHYLLYWKQKNNISTNTLTLTPQLLFVGDKKEEIALEIDDPNKELHTLKNVIQKTLDDILEPHKESPVTATASDHSSNYLILGRISWGTVEKVNPLMVANIKKGIEVEIIPFLHSWLESHDAKLYLDSFCLYDSVTKQCTKEYILQAIPKFKKIL